MPVGVMPVGVMPVGVMPVGERPVGKDWWEKTGGEKIREVIRTECRPSDESLMLY
jgi:hypothetical protein